jgi:hypothetical protein
MKAEEDSHIDEKAQLSAAALKDIIMIHGYVEWVKAFGTITAPVLPMNCTRCSFDEKTRKAYLSATYHAKQEEDRGFYEQGDAYGPCLHNRDECRGQDHQL